MGNGEWNGTGHVCDRWRDRYVVAERGRNRRRDRDIEPDPRHLIAQARAVGRRRRVMPRHVMRHVMAADEHFPDGQAARTRGQPASGRECEE